MLCSVAEADDIDLDILALSISRYAHLKPSMERRPRAVCLHDAFLKHNISQTGVT